MEEILHQLTGSLSQRFTRFHISQVLQDFFQQYCSFGYPCWIYGACCENLRGHDSRQASCPRSSPIPWRTRHETEATLERWNSWKWKGCVSPKIQWLTVFFFTFYKQASISSGISLWGVAFFGACETSPPKKRHLWIWHSDFAVSSHVFFLVNRVDRPPAWALPGIWFPTWIGWVWK